MQPFFFFLRSKNQENGAHRQGGREGARGGAPGRAEMQGFRAGAAEADRGAGTGRR
jgi:hypothetical protein